MASVPTSEARPCVAAPASPKIVDDDARRSNNDAGQSTTNDRGSSACARINHFHEDSLSATDSRGGPIGAREKQLVVHLQDCLKHMMHLRGWLRLLDQELG